jgi:phenylpropionate dioxygenase-like ring-hydroxylating dioxygenase large terminal subunit
VLTIGLGFQAPILSISITFLTVIIIYFAHPTIRSNKLKYVSISIFHNLVTMTISASELILNSPKTLPVGGMDETKFDYREVWYPLFFVEDLDRSKPTSFTLLEEELVIWWDKNEQQWQVFTDKCPHRLAPLSEGRINQQGWLECPYHGWAFSGKGNCEMIPQQVANGNAEKSNRACVRSFPTMIKQGLLFVYPGKSENASLTPVPIVEPLEENREKWVILNTFRDLPYDALTLLENVLDSSHIPYTHHGSVGNRSNVSPVNLEAINSDRQGFRGIWPEGPRQGKLGTQYTTFIAPNLMWHDLTSKQFGRTMTVVYVTPIRKGKCRLFARFPFQFSSKIPEFLLKLTPRWYSHLNQNAILEDDQIFLHYQERHLEKAGGSEKFAQAFYLPTKADLFVSELRKWVNNYNAQLFPEKHLPATPNQEILLERYHSHTEKCGSCSKALKRIKTIRFSLAIATAILWSLTPLISLNADSLPAQIAIASGVISLLNVGIYLWLGKLERRFYDGQLIAPRNLPEK